MQHKKKLRQIMYYNWCFRHFAAENLLIISLKLIDFVYFFSMAIIQKSQTCFGDRDERRYFFTLFNIEKGSSPSVFATGKFRYIRRIIATSGKVSIKQFFFKYDSCACAVFVFKPRSGDERK